MAVTIRARLLITIFSASMFFAEAVLSSELDFAPVFSGRFVMFPNGIPYVLDETSPVGTLMEYSSLLITYRPLRERSIEPTLADLTGRTIPYVDAEGQQCIARLGKLHAVQYFELPYFQYALERYFPEAGEIGFDTTKSEQLLARISTEQTLLHQLYHDENLNTNNNYYSSTVGFELTDLDSSCGAPVVAGFAIKMAAAPEKPATADKRAAIVTALLRDSRVLDSFESARERENALERKDEIGIAYFHLAGQTFIEATSGEIGCREAESTDFALYAVTETKGNKLKTLFARGTLERYQEPASLAVMTSGGLMLVWQSWWGSEILDVRTGTIRRVSNGTNACPC